MGDEAYGTPAEELDPPFIPYTADNKYLAGQSLTWPDRTCCAVTSIDQILPGGFGGASGWRLAETPMGL